MSIYEYDNITNPHPSGWEGLRVVVSCCLSGGHQRYFNFRVRNGREYVSLREERRIRHEAAALEREWLQLQARERRLCTDQARTWSHPDAPTSTGVAGIRMTFKIDTKTRNGSTRHYYTPAFIVHGSDANERFLKTVRIARGRVAAGWREAVRFYCQHKGIKGPAVDRLIRRRPPATQFEAVRQDLSKRLGHEIPKDKVPA